MASVQNIGINGERNKVDHERAPLAMSKETSLPMNRTPGRDSYWFAYGRTEDTASANALTDSKTTVEQKEREEKLRLFREHQEEERLRKLRGLEHQFLLAQRHREQQEEERRRRLEEARVREAERRQQVEERKRQIWEAEQERKEAILRRNMEREARIEARRNAQRNSQSFAFGSSTPRTFDLDLAAIGRHTSAALLMSSVGRRSEEREVGPPRATSACSLDRKFESDRSYSLDPLPSFLSKQIALHQKSSHDMKACLSMQRCDDPWVASGPATHGWLVGSGEDCMSRSMVSLSSSSSCTFRGRKRTDITPTLSRGRSATPIGTTPAARGNALPHCSRAVSMTRLDQLAQPRRSFHHNAPAGAPPPDLSRSMCNLATTPTGRRGPGSRSTLTSPQPRLSPASPGAWGGGMRPAQSMVHLAPPRMTRAARLRAQARAASAWNLNGAEPSTGKDSSRSPSRPQSSMSGTSDASATSSSVSGVNLRPRPAPRRPRPYSMVGSITLPTKEEPQRQTRGHDRSVAAAPRAKSACRGDGAESKRPLPRKPLPPPKSSELIAKAKSHPVPTKDNLRKVNKSANKPSPAPVVKATAESCDPQDKIECKRKKAEQEQLNSAVTSPTTDSEMMAVSSDDSKMDSVDQSIPSEKSPAAPPVEVPEAPAPPVEPQEKLPSDKPEALTEPQEKAPLEPQAKPQQRAPAEAHPSSDGPEEVAPSKPRITSEEEARAALAEKRRLAREQAEREAELERQRQEKIRLEEEAEREREEAEQRRMEEEQLRLSELHRRMEEEKLAKAIEEQRQREREEQERREEEQRQRVEKEEQERKAREEAEKQRVELEEKLRREEEERAERKRRVEQIMARTRGKSAAPSPSGTPSENKVAPMAPKGGIPDIPNGTLENGNGTWPDLLNAALPPAKQNGAASNQTMSANEGVSSPHSNGYSDHEDMSCTTSPEDGPDVGLLIDVQTTTTPSSVGNVNNDNFLICVDDVNSNLFSDPFAAVEVLQKKQDAQVTDLLS